MNVLLVYYDISCLNDFFYYKDFLSVYGQLSSADPDPNLVDEQAKQWINDFVALSSSMEGHQKSCVTPYMHVLAYHVPDMIRKHGSIRRFSGQGKQVFWYSMTIY